MQIFATALWDALGRFLNKGGTVRASHVALSMMLAIFPFCLLALSLAGVVSRIGLTGSENELGDILDLVFGSWPETIADPIEREVRAVMETSGGSTITLGALLTILFASNGFDAVRIAVSEAYHDRDPRPLWKRRLIAAGFALGGAALVTVSGLFGVILPAYVRLAAEYAPILHLEIVTHETVVFWLTSFVLLAGLVAVHKWLPGVKRPLRAIMPGVTLTVLLWVVIAYGFDYYVSNFPTYSVTYAGLAGVIAALVFLYLMSAVLVLGAEYNARLGEIGMARKDNDLQER
jgi:membrane protein